MLKVIAILAALAMGVTTVICEDVLAWFGGLFKTGKWAIRNPRPEPEEKE